MPTPAIMLQGTGSDVGKSLLVAGLCRYFTQQGLKVRPFKAQNMSNNAAVTAEGGEIGRAQALQARACGVVPSVHMNPVLLKPESEMGAQVIVQGKRIATLKARDYFKKKPELLTAVLDSYQRLSGECDLVIVEGAGSPAEVNLRKGDIANMGFAEAADLPVVLVADIDRGGVIASIAGSWLVLPEEDRARIKGYIVNKFRGDLSLFDEGLEIITAHTAWPSFGVLPFFDGAGKLPAEDAVALDQKRQREGQSSKAIKIAVPRFARIANHDDFDALAQEPDVALEIVPPGQALPGDADLIILPGSKSTIGDLGFLRQQGWDLDITAHLRRGGQILGICGGYQMLGKTLHDPEGIEGPAGSVEGLGLLDLETIMTPEKTLIEVTGSHLPSGQAVRGYEMHIGRSEGPDCARAFLDLVDHQDGAISKDGKVAGCYLHGLFTSDGFRAAFLSSLKEREVSGLAYEAQVEETLDRLADHIGRFLDCQGLLSVARGN